MYAKMKALGTKFGFTVLPIPSGFALYAKTTDRKSLAWLRYNTEKGTLFITGNTDNCNLWFHETRKDLTAEKILQFVEELNQIFSFEKPLKVSDLIDPEDWQEIANIKDAYLDPCYTQQYQAKEEEKC